MLDSSIRQRDKADSYSFENLLDQGIDLLQQLSGNLWTDYNLHDPGVTLLEQLCFALTDIAYRADRELAQYLVGEDGRIDLPGLGLYGPSKVLSSGPVTPADFERLLIDNITGLSRVFVDIEHGHCGEFIVSQGVDETGREQIRARIVELYQSLRPLCHSPSLVFKEIESDIVGLSGTLEVESGYHAVQVLAEVLLFAEQYLTPASEYTGYERLLSAGESLDSILEGPFLAGGALQIRENNTLLASTLSRQLLALPGVKAVRNLQFRTSDGHLVGLLENNIDKVLALPVPKAGQDLYLTVQQDRKSLVIQAEQLAEHVDQLRMRSNAKPFSISVNGDIFPTVEREYWPLDESSPIVHQLPAVYLESAGGDRLPADMRQQAGNRQLNGYLMLFEQFIANAFSGLSRARELFSINREIDKSYFSQPLEYPEAQNLYRKFSSGNIAETLADIVSMQDDYVDRRNRALDYLLALYGESFPDEAFIKFDNSADETGIKRDLIRAKVVLLKHIPAVGFRRLQAQDMSKPLPWEDPEQYGMNMSGMQLRASLMLGFWDLRQRSLTDLYAKLSLSITEDYHYPPLVVAGADASGSTEDRARAVENVVHEHFRPAIGAAAATSIPPQDVAKLFDELKQHGLFKDGLHAGFLRAGIDASRYRIGRGGGSHPIVLAFRFGDRQWVSLGSFKDVKTARQVAVGCRQFLQALNRLSEGMHVVEHALLNPRQTNATPSAINSYQVSIVLPDWPVRFSSMDFQRFVEESIRQCCPAHILCRFHWLSYGDMQRFEALYRRWHETLPVSGKPGAANDRADTRGSADRGVFEEAAAALKDFLNRVDGSQPASPEVRV